MRRRLVVSTLVIAVVAVLLLGVPLAIAVGRLVVDETQQRLQRDATAIATSVEIRAERGETIPSQDIERTYPDRYVVILYPGGQQIMAGPNPPGPHITERARSAGGALVVVSADRATVRRQELGVVLLVAVVSLAAIGVAVVLAVLESRRLTNPLTDLAGRADRLGSGEALPTGQRYGIAELDRVAEVLDNSASRLGRLLAAERDFATDASHQLRTPLAALSMRLEEIAGTADDPEVVAEEAQAALAQVERLTQVVDQLLVAARSGRDAEVRPTEIDRVIGQQLDEWEPAFRRAGRCVRFEGDRGLRARASTGGLSQVVATLLDNALVHGAGTTTVRASATPQSVVVEVGDEGPGVPADLAPRIFDRHVSGGDGTGLGLSLARSLAEADGGRLALVCARPATFAVFLRPVREQAPAQRVVGGPV